MRGFCFSIAGVQGMDSFEFNKIAGAVLGTALVVFGLKEVAGIIYHADAPEKPGMVIDVAEAASTQGEAAAEETPSKPIGELLAAADAAKGEGGMKACKACHTWDNGGANKAGPNLWNIVGRNIAAGEGFKYSSAFTEKSSETWSYEALDGFLKKPKEYIPGTKMGYAGIKDEEKRADLIAFLRTLSDSPQPLPGQ
jgi:cytochrome c